MEKESDKIQEFKKIIEKEFTSKIQIIIEKDEIKEQHNAALTEKIEMLSSIPGFDIDLTDLDIGKLDTLRKDYYTTDYDSEEFEIYSKFEEMYLEQLEIDKIDEELQQIVQKSVDQSRGFQEKIQDKIKECKEKQEKISTEIEELKKLDEIKEEKGEVSNNDGMIDKLYYDISCLELEIEDLQKRYDIVEDFLSKYGSLESLREVIKEKDAKEEENVKNNYLYDEDMQEYGYFDEWIIGDEQTEQKTETTKAEPTKAEPTKTKPTKAEPTKTEPTKAEPTKTKPTKAEPTKAEPTKTEPTKAEPTKTKPTKAEPTKTEPTKTEPTKTEFKNPQLTIIFDAKEKAYIVIDKTNSYETKITLEMIEKSEKYQQYTEENVLTCEGADLKLAHILHLYDHICKNKGEKTNLEYTYLSSFDLDATPEERQEYLANNNLSIKYDLSYIKKRGLFARKERKEIIRNAKNQHKLGIAEYDKPKSRFTLFKENISELFNKNKALGPGKEDKFIDEKDYTEEGKDLIEATKKREQYREYLAKKAERMNENGDQIITPSRAYRESVREQNEIVSNAEAERYEGTMTAAEAIEKADRVLADTER